MSSTSTISLKPQPTTKKCECDRSSPVSVIEYMMGIKSVKNKMFAGGGKSDSYSPPARVKDSKTNWMNKYEMLKLK